MLKNRIINAPMSPPDFGSDSTLTKDNVAFYDLRAKGGCAVVTVSEGIVHMKTGRSHTKQLALDNPLCRPSLAETARTIHHHDCFASIELSHAGKYAGNRAQDEEGKSMTRYGPVDEILPNGAVVHEMPETLIYEIAESFGSAAALVKSAGFDMILIHAAHGWLINQFMSPATNTRVDKWGGRSIENRMRFPLLIIEKIREAVGPAFPIEYRMSGAEYTPGGYGIDEAIEIAKVIDGKVDIIHVSAGVHEDREGMIITHPTMFDEHGSNVHLAAEIKKHVKTVVATVGGLNDPEKMEEIIATGKADIVEMSRQLLADPFFPQKALTGKRDSITKCCRCFTCLSSFLTNRIAICAVNPVIGRELDHQYSFAPTAPKKVVIAGGGPSGMMAALTAKSRGHEVILFEKNDRLGGQLLSEEFVPFKDALYAYAVQQSRRVMDSGIDVRLNTELTAELIDTIQPDFLVLAVGAKQIVPDIPGIESKKVVGLEALHQKHPNVGKKVVILGGGLVGCETAIYLSKLGIEVTVVEMKNDCATDAAEMHKIAIEKEFRNNMINLHLNTTAKAVTEDGLLCIGPDGKSIVYDADTIFLAAGMHPDFETVEALRYNATWSFSIGDCVKAGKVVDAVYNGYYSSLDI